MRVAAVLTSVDPGRAGGLSALVTWLRARGVATHVFRSWGDAPGPGHAGTTTVWPRPPPYAEGLNEGLRWALDADAELVLILNDDLRVLRDDWLAEIEKGSERHPGSLVGPKLLYPDGRVQHAGGFLLRLGSGTVAGGHYGDAIEIGTPLVDLERPCEFLTGACLGIPRAVLDDVGLFDESLPAWEDSEYALRARRLGHAAWYIPTSVLEHTTGNASRSSPGARRLYLEKQRSAAVMVVERYRDLLFPPPPRGEPR